MELVEKYKNLPDTEFVPLECVDEAFKGKYKINKLGWIKNMETDKVRYNTIFTGIHYPRASFRVGNLKKDYPLHILVAKTFIPNPENKSEIDHIDRNINNPIASNLRWSTRKENLLNRSNVRRKNLYFKKIDPTTKEVIEIIDYKNFSVREVEAICSSIRSGCMHEGFLWERGDHDVDNYIEKYGYPKEDEWIESKKFPGVFCNKNGMLKINEKLTIGFKDISGYRKISINRKPYFIHRIIYEAFYGDIGDLIIDHASTIPDDNRLINLSAMDQKGNMKNPKTLEKLSKPVKRFSLSGEYQKEYDSLNSATKEMKGNPDYNGRDNTIQLCCIGKLLTAFGYLWCFVGEEDKIVEKTNNIVFKYDNSFNFIKSYKSIKQVETESTSSRNIISNYIDTGKLAPDGHYYYHGPHEFPDEEQNKNQD